MDICFCQQSKMKRKLAVAEKPYNVLYCLEMFFYKQKNYKKVGYAMLQMYKMSS